VPARDLYHDCVKKALIGEGWTITHDPYVLSAGGDRVFVDLGADASGPLAAERGGEKIAVEIKSFRGQSLLTDLERAVGQYVVYRTMLADEDPERALYLAVTEDVYKNLMDRPIARRPLESLDTHLIVFRPDEERIILWTR
jgi:hypothetical protein